MNTTLMPIDFFALSPLLVILGGALLLLLLESLLQPFAKRFSFWLALGTLIVALGATLQAPVSENPLLTPWLRFDPLAKLFNIFFITIGLATTLLASSFFQRFNATRGEYYFLLLSALFGLLLIGMSADFLTLFLGIETLSLALYIMCGYMKNWKFSPESAMKYFLMGALAAAFLLYGIALIYGAVGTTRFDELLTKYQNIPTDASHALFFSGIALVTLGLLFEAAIVPFHVWAPDVYDGAPTPVTAFMAVGTKVGAFAAFAIIFLKTLPHFDPLWNDGIALLAYPTLIYANYVALRQTQLRRFFAYSGISHAGFLLIPLAAGTPDALSALLFYLAIYSFATLGSFAVLAFLDQRSEGVMLTDLYGLFHRSPLLAGGLSICILTLSGTPPTVGFFAKFFIFKIAFQAGYYSLVIVGLLTTILSAFYYLRIVGVMFSEPARIETPPLRSWPAAVVGLVSVVAIIVLSFYPEPFMTFLASVKG